MIKPGANCLIRSTPLVSLASRLLCFLSISFVPAKAAVDEIELGFPVRCELGVTCFIQNYVDHDSSNQVRDYQCGGRTYDGHDGTDIRVPDLEIQRGGVEVLVSAPGRVVAIRDGIEDISIRSTGKAAVAGKECGNGVVVEHGDNWRSQYCHLARSSVRVKVGDRVVAGQSIGLVGLSGATEFPHLHFSVRHQGKIVDPFAHGAPAGSCGDGHSLWSDAVREQAKYRPREILNFGFSSLAPTMDLVESGEVRKHPVRLDSDAFSAYVRAIGLQADDQQMITLRGPDGAVISEYKAQPLDRDKAQYFVASGKRRKMAYWTPGIYKATYRVMKSDEEVLSKTYEVELGPK
jgi:murein DD-endopeptidase MepM/ murein hydrolase activator NlpD